MVAQFEIQSRTTSVKLDRTPEGWNCFELVFFAAMSLLLILFVATFVWNRLIRRRKSTLMEYKGRPAST